MDSPETTLGTQGTQDIVRRQIKTTTQKTRKLSNTHTTKNWGWPHVFAKAKQFLSLIRHTLCNSENNTIAGFNTIENSPPCKCYSNF